jgi:hypothetical protein
MPVAPPPLGRVDEHCTVLLDGRLLRLVQSGFRAFCGALYFLLLLLGAVDDLDAHIRQ